MSRLSILIGLLGAWIFPLTGHATQVDRMTPTEAQSLLNKISEISRATDERLYAAGSTTNLVFFPQSGSPSSVISRVKFNIKNVAGKYIDVSKLSQGTYDAWFSSVVTNKDVQTQFGRPIEFPYWSGAKLENYLGLPASGFDQTPVGGKELLQSSVNGLELCHAALGSLVDLPVKLFVQQNSGGFKTLFTNETFNAIWYDEGHCLTNNCTSRTDTVYFGAPLTYRQCEIPAAPSSPTNYSGRAIWDINFSASYQHEITQNADDYHCVSGRAYTWNDTKREDEAQSISLAHRFTDAITLVCTGLVRDVEGTLRPYSRYVYNRQAPTYVTTHVTLGCEDIYCDLYDDEGEVIGTYRCNTRELVVPQTNTVSGWDPGLASNFVYSGHSSPKSTGQNAASLSMPVISDPFGDVEPSLTRSEMNSCNNVFSGAFGLACIGRYGSTIESEACSVAIPRRVLEYEITPILLEANFEYCPR